MDKLDSQKGDIVEKILTENEILRTDMMSKEQIKVVLENLKTVLDNNIEGDVVELGCYVGTTSLFIRRLLNAYNSDKKFHVYDSFEGLPEKGKEDKNKSPISKLFKKGFIKVPKEFLIENFKKAKLESPIINKGWFNNIHNRKFPKKISFGFFDGDFYSSITHSFKKVYPRLTSGARIVIDDYDWDATPGVEKACRDFLKDKPEKGTLVTIKGEGVFIKKHLIINKILELKKRLKY